MSARNCGGIEERMVGVVEAAGGLVMGVETALRPEETMDLAVCPRCGHIEGMGRSVTLMRWREGGWNVSCPHGHVERGLARCASPEGALEQWRRLRDAMSWGGRHGAC